MDYERQNAKEWQFNPASGPNPGTAASEVEDEDYQDFGDVLIPIDTNEAQDAELGWSKVTHKKPPAKSPSKPIPKQAPKPLGNTAPGLRATAPFRNSPPKLPAKPPPKHTPRFSAPLPANPSLPAPQPALQTTLPLATANRPKTAPPQKPRLFTFAHKNDNPARAAFRAQQPPTNKFVLSKHCYDIEPDRKRMYDILEEMGVRFGSFVLPPQSAQDRDLLLWGNDEQVTATIRELQNWVLQSNFTSHTTKGGNQFAKTGDLQQDKAKSLDKLMKREAIKQRYQKVPDSTLKFDFTGYFLWPVDEIRPEDLLGPSYEAFDPIRIDYDSHIVFDNQLSLFKILTNTNNAVQEVMRRIEGTMKEFVARNRREVVVHMVERPDPRRMRSKVVVMEGPSLGRGQQKAKIPMLTGKSLASAQLTEWKKEIKTAEELQFVQWSHLTSKMIKRLRLYRGRLQMRVLLGKFTLTTFRRSLEGADGISFEEFLEVMDQPGTRGRMIKDLQERESPKVLLGYINSATKIFTPTDALTTKLDDVSPVYTARFEFDIPGTGKVKLEIERSIPSSTELYETTQSVWTRKTEKVEAIHPMELFMIRLHGGISWEFQVSTSQALDASRITPMMTAFVDSVKFKLPPKDERPKIWDSALKVFTWTSSMSVSSFEQKTSLRYRIVDNSDWMFEFARYDDYGGSIPGAPMSSSPSTSWGATFWNSEWDRALGQNASLKIGEAAKWDPKLDKFFPGTRRTGGDPRESAGLKLFLAKTKAIAELLDGSKVEGF
ncbi:hypothetical protein MMC22_009057 [Lobaria immixta]|nr:hypothetical protein [Lobaria immixta]